MKSSSSEPKARFNRREFLNFAWLASLGFLVFDLGGITIIYAMPRFREGEFGGRFHIGSADEVLPSPGGNPVNKPKGKFWISNTENGQVVTLYKVCTHLGCLYSWIETENKFICPCHGSQFELDGTYIKGPAPRSLDRFIVRFLDEEGNDIAHTDLNGNPIEPPDENSQIVVETGELIRGKTRDVSYPEI